jgi:uncharacterized membrane protein
MTRSDSTIEKVSAAIGCVLVVVLAALPLFHAGLFPTMDNISVVRIQSMATQLSSGQFPVRYSSDLAHGHGYELFQYYAPLPYYTGAFLHLVGVNIVGALKRSYFIALLIAASGMAGLSFTFFGLFGAVVSVAAFVFAPYMGFDIYWRGDVGETWAMSFTPWVLWFVFRAMKYAKRSDTVLAGVFWSFVILSHTLTAYMASAFLLGWTLLWNRYMKRSVWSPIFILVISFGLSAFFWLPVALTRGQIWVMHLQGNKSEILAQSLSGSLRDLLFSSFQPVITNWFALCIPLLGAILVLKYSKDSINRMVVSVSLGLFLFAGFMASKFSGFIWAPLFPVLYIFQFPWRFLTMLTIFGAFLSGGIALASPKYRYVLVAAMVMIAILVNWNNFRPKLYEFVDRYVPQDPCGTSWGFEYLPIWVKTCLKTSWNTPYQIQSGDIDVFSSQTYPRKVVLQTRSSQRSVIDIDRYFYPGWEARVDGVVIEIGPSYPYGLVEVAVPPGEHSVVFRLQSTWYERVSNYVSTGTAVSVILYIAWRKRRK